MDKAGKVRTRWTDRSILNADPRTADSEDIISMLRSHGISVAEKHTRSQLVNLLKALQQQIQKDAEEAGAQTEAEPRKRGSSRKKVATKSALAKEDLEEMEDESTVPRNKRKSGGPATVKKVTEESDEEEPEKKKKKSVGKPARKSGAKPVKRSSADESKPQEEEEVPEEQEKIEPANKRKSKGATTRGVKRAPEKTAEEIREEGSAEDKETQFKPPKSSRRSSVSKPKNRKIKGRCRSSSRCYSCSSRESSSC